MTQAAPVRIAFVEQAERIGGAEVNLLALLQKCDRTMIDPVVICSRRGPLTEALDAAGYPWEFLRLPRLASVSIRVAGRKVANPVACLWDLAAIQLSAASLARYLRRHPAQLACSVGLVAHLYTAKAARSAGIPCVWHLQDIVSAGRAGGLFRKWLRGTAEKYRPSVISISGPVSETLEGLGLNIIEVPNGVNIEEYASADGSSLCRELGLPPETPLVGIVGRITPWKGQLDFVRAAALVARSRTDVQFVVAGEAWPSDGWYLDQVRKEVLTSGISSKVHLLGFRKDIPEVIKGLDILALCSVEPEPFGRVLIEGMAAGTAVIATDKGGAADIVRNEDNGLLVAPSDVHALAQAILRLLQDADLRHSVAARARRDAQEKYSLDSHVAQITSALLKACDGSLM